MAKRTSTKPVKPQPAYTYAPVDQALVMLRAAEILDGQIVALELGGMFEAVMKRLNELGYNVVRMQGFKLTVEKREEDRGSSDTIQH